MKFADQLRNVVKDSGLSAYEICKQAGIDQGNFSKFLRGHVWLAEGTLDKIAAVLRLRIVIDPPIAVAKPSAKAKRRIK